jgi:hypothetical protein
MESGADVPGDAMHKGSKKPKPCREASEAEMSLVFEPPNLAFLMLYCL